MPTPRSAAQQFLALFRRHGLPLGKMPPPMPAAAATTSTALSSTPAAGCENGKWKSGNQAAESEHYSGG
ncbi:MAG: hypothetical protein WDM77_11685 [Steroidobacteraceae bacterium]